MTECKYSGTCTGEHFTKYLCHCGSTHKLRMGDTQIGCDLYRRYELKHCEICLTKDNSEAWLCINCCNVLCVKCKDTHICSKDYLERDTVEPIKKLVASDSKQKMKKE